jgi:hypothetical protein
MTAAGERFAQALAARDGAALQALLADPIDFAALTPRRPWQATSAGQVVDEIILGHWFDAEVQAMDLQSVTTGRVSDREHVAYRLGVRNADGDFLVEQQAYYSTDGERITWLRILCSGYRPARDAAPAAP